MVVVEVHHLPNLLRAGSMLLGLFVAAMTMTWDRCFRPSINVNSWDTIRLSTSPCVWIELSEVVTSCQCLVDEQNTGIIITNTRQKVSRAHNPSPPPNFDSQHICKFKIRKSNIFQKIPYSKTLHCTSPVVIWRCWSCWLIWSVWSLSWQQVFTMPI